MGSSQQSWVVFGGFYKKETILCGPALLIRLDKAPRLSIRVDIWILLSDTICQLIQFYTNSEAALLPTYDCFLIIAALFLRFKVSKYNMHCIF